MATKKQTKKSKTRVSALNKLWRQPKFKKGALLVLILLLVIGGYFVWKSFAYSYGEYRWGTAGDIPVSMDVNNDNQTDLVVYRPSNGYWYVKDIRSGVMNEFKWGGIVNDKPFACNWSLNNIAQDFVILRSNGQLFLKDGVNGSTTTLNTGIVGNNTTPFCLRNFSGGADSFALFNADNGYWRLVWRVQPPETIQWGAAGDIPAIVNYFSKDVPDLAVFRPSEGKWYIREIWNPSGAPRTATVRWGTAGDIPAAGKFASGYVDDNPDPAYGLWNLAVWRPSNGYWYVKDFANFAWGTKGDIPLTGDYNKDGRMDYTIFRPSTGRWYIRYGP